jgi:hypothetical protein
MIPYANISEYISSLEGGEIYIKILNWKKNKNVDKTITIRETEMVIPDSLIHMSKQFLN